VQIKRVEWISFLLYVREKIRHLVKVLKFRIRFSSGRVRAIIWAAVNLHGARFDVKIFSHVTSPGGGEEEDLCQNDIG